MNQDMTFKLTSLTICFSVSLISKQSVRPAGRRFLEGFLEGFLEANLTPFALPGFVLIPDKLKYDKAAEQKLK